MERVKLICPRGVSELLHRPRSERSAAPIRARRGRVQDPNFIGFDKYRRDGAYHWVELTGVRITSRRIDLVTTTPRPLTPVSMSGVATAPTVIYLAQQVTSVVAVDADLMRCDTRGKSSSVGASRTSRCAQLVIVELSLDRLGVAEPFDIVYSMDVIEHLPEPEQLLERAVEVVSPSGRVVIGTPLHLGDHLVSQYHVREFTREELLALVAPWLHVEDVHLLPMRRLDHVTYREGFIVVVGRPG